MFIKGGATNVAAAPYTITKSLRSASASSQRLSRTFGTPTTQNTFTISLWIKRGILGVLQNFFGVSTNNSIGFTSSDTLVVTLAGSATITTSQVFKDVGAWMHIVYKQTTGASELYVNGVSVGTSATISSVFNTAVSHQLDCANTSNYFDGYLTEVIFVDGQSLSPSSFGETETATGQWIAKDYTGSYGANGFYLDFLDGTSTTTLGDDKSGNNNDWTLTNFTRSAGINDCFMSDVPTGNGTNVCVMSPIDKGGSMTITNGNLSGSIGLTWNIVRGTVGMSSGKWYWEGQYNATSGLLGITGFVSNLDTNLGVSSADYGYQSSGHKWNNNVQVSYGTSYVSTDVIGIAFDASAGTIEFFKNGTSQGVAYSSIPAGTYYPAFSMYSGTVTANLGQRPFVHTPPTGYKALNTNELTSTDVVESGSFTGNANANGRFVWCNGTLETLTINGNAVTWGTHADRLSNGFKIRTSSSSYNSSGTNTWTATVLSPESKSAFLNQNAKGN